MNQKSGEKKQSHNTKRLLIRIAVPVLIVITVAGIYFFKNQPKGGNDNHADSLPAAQTSEKNAEQTETQAADSAGNTGLDFSSSEFDLDATDNFDFQKILSYGLPVIIDFGSDSCDACKKMEPVLEELNKELRGKVIVKFVDVWVNADAAKIFPLRVIPTQFFFDKDGKPYVPSDAESSSFIMYGHQLTNAHMFTAHEGGMTKDEIMAALKEMGVE